jgi:hypothetical protein
MTGSFLRRLRLELVRDHAAVLDGGRLCGPVVGYQVRFAQVGLGDLNAEAKNSVPLVAPSSGARY